MHVIHVTFNAANIIFVGISAVAMMLVTTTAECFNIVRIGGMAIVAMIIMLPVIFSVTGVYLIGLILVVTLIIQCVVIMMAELICNGEVTIIELLLNVAGHVVQVPVVRTMITSVIVAIFRCLERHVCGLASRMASWTRPSKIMQRMTTVTQVLQVTLT